MQGILTSLRLYRYKNQVRGKPLVKIITAVSSTSSFVVTDGQPFRLFVRSVVFARSSLYRVVFVASLPHSATGYFVLGFIVDLNQRLIHVSVSSLFRCSIRRRNAMKLHQNLPNSESNPVLHRGPLTTFAINLFQPDRNT